jgi:hypothetical protein
MLSPSSTNRYQPLFQGDHDTMAGMASIVAFHAHPDDEVLLTGGTRLASVILQERADVLLSYDPQGGYGHPDHVKVHQVGALATQMTSTRILEATLPRELVALLFCPLRAPAGWRACTGPCSPCPFRSSACCSDASGSSSPVAPPSGFRRYLVTAQETGSSTGVCRFRGARTRIRW